MTNEKKFIKELKCEELDVIARKKRTENKQTSKRMAKLAEMEMNDKLCETQF